VYVVKVNNFYISQHLPLETTPAFIKGCLQILTGNLINQNNDNMFFVESRTEGYKRKYGN
jgi:hypothetical protein